MNPILAEIADKMPGISGMWEYRIAFGTPIAALAFALHFVKRPYGPAMGFVVVLLVVWLGALVAWPDPSFDRLIRNELGLAYLWHHRASALTPAAMALSTWLLGLALLKDLPQHIKTLQKAIGLPADP